MTSLTLVAAVAAAAADDSFYESCRWAGINVRFNCSLDTNALLTRGLGLLLHTNAVVLP